MYRYVTLYEHEKKFLDKSGIREIRKKIEDRYPGWQVAFKDERTTVLEWQYPESKMKCHHLSRSGGIILGHLFRNKPDETVLKISEQEDIFISDNNSEKIILSSGSSLCDDYWGSYVAFIRNQEKNGLYVIRSPFCTLPCFHFYIGEGSIFFSDPSLFDILVQYGVGIDWNKAALYFRYAWFDTEKSAFSNLDILFHSQRLTFEGQEKKIEFVWDPRRFLSSEPIRDASVAAQLLRNVTFSCFGSWASLFPKMLVQLSGGLDSSIVAGCMAKLDSPPELICMTVYNEMAGSDERYYARLAAAHSRLGLEEVREDFNVCDTSLFSNWKRLPWPTTFTTSLDSIHAEERIVSNFGATVKVTGHNGDGLFLRVGQNAVAHDYVIHNGFGKGALRVAMQSAQVSNKSIWATFSGMLNARYRALRGLPFSEPRRNNVYDYSWGLSADIADIVRNGSLSAPWNRGEDRTPPGKRAQIRGVMGPLDSFPFVHGQSAVREIHPLMSQPIVELCLRIPSHLMIYSGRERGLARFAFADCLPEAVRLRQFKANGGPFFAEMLRRNARPLAEVLLEGVLVNAHILDKNTIENVRKSPDLLTSEQSSMLMNFVSVELWARAWEI